MSHRIETGQEYALCAARPDDQPRIRVVGDPITTLGLHGFGKVDIVTLTADGREIRRRAIEMTQLHETGTTRDGQPRKTGYRLVRHADGSPADGAQQ